MTQNRIDHSFLRDLPIQIEKSKLTVDEEKALIVTDDAHVNDWRELNRKEVQSEVGEVSYLEAYQGIAYQGVRYMKILRTENELIPIWTKLQFEFYFNKSVKSTNKTSDDSENQFDEDIFFDKYQFETWEYGMDSRIDHYQTKKVVFDPERNVDDFEGFSLYAKHRLFGSTDKQVGSRKKYKMNSPKWRKTFPLYRWKDSDTKSLIRLFKSKIGGERRKAYNYDYHTKVLTKLKDKLVLEIQGLSDAEVIKKGIRQYIKKGELQADEYYCIMRRNEYQETFKKIGLVVGRTGDEVCDMIKKSIYKITDIICQNDGCSISNLKEELIKALVNHLIY
jgi:hypothetical protein